MKKELKMARNFLKDSTRSEFEKVIYDSKLTPIQEKVIRRHILDNRSVCSIMLELNCSEACVRRALSAAYQHVFRLINDRSESNLSAII